MTTKAYIVTEHDKTEPLTKDMQFAEGEWEYKIDVSVGGDEWYSESDDGSKWIETINNEDENGETYSKVYVIQGDVDTIKELVTREALAWDVELEWVN